MRSSTTAPLYASQSTAGAGRRASQSHSNGNYDQVTSCLLLAISVCPPKLHCKHGNLSLFDYFSLFVKFHFDSEFIQWRTHIHLTPARFLLLYCTVPVVGRARRPRRAARRPDGRGGVPAAGVYGHYDVPEMLIGEDALDMTCKLRPCPCGAAGGGSGVRAAGRRPAGGGGSKTQSGTLTVISFYGRRS